VGEVAHKKQVTPNNKTTKVRPRRYTYPMTPTTRICLGFEKKKENYKNQNNAYVSGASKVPKVLLQAHQALWSSRAFRKKR
jgi:hypothetical protein